MTNNDLKEFWALVCGKCYHEWDNIKPVTVGGYHRCIKCSKLTKSKTQFNPYVTFEDTIELSLEARKLIERQWPKMWDGYIAYILYSFCLSKNSYPHSEIFQQKHKPEYLYAYMKLHPEDWAGVECPEVNKHLYPVDSKQVIQTIGLITVYCDCINGKIPNPKYAKVVEWIKDKNWQETEEPITEQWDRERDEFGD